MTLRTPTGILGEIVVHKQSEVTALLEIEGDLRKKAEANRALHRPFSENLRTFSPAIIAEVKKASPSKGLLQPNFDPTSIAATYQAGGAACLSVLTDARYFQGGLDDLAKARQATQLPVLRKDFTIHPVQIYEAAANYADAILLIAAILEPAELRSYRELAAELGLAALVEVHDEPELLRAIESGADIIGVNNRNLKTFEVSLDVSLRLSEKIPSSAIRVAESGIFTRSDIELLLGAGFHGFLVGESLMKAPNPAEALRSLRG
jgi:indole-3-glycerol phosphate synthase